ncbi:MAG: pilin [Candidatus Nomurabacteria bacterium]|jgi:hypothetical protein|nr:pilin [Candidatus Nomurabacteria bacterium]
MKLSIKKIVGALLVVPVLALSVSVFGFNATPASAAAPCPSNLSGYNGKCTDSGGNDGYYSNGRKVTKEEFCKLDSGLAAGVECAKGEGQAETLTGNGGIVTTIINVMLFVIGILCVVMIIFGGIRYTTSTGDKGRVDAAKNTIVYAVVGLIVAIVAYALVNWVFNALQ